MKEVEKAPLVESRKEIAKRLKKKRTYLGLLKKQLRTFRSNRRKSGEGLESKMFKLLREIGVKLTHYHGGSLNGKDIRKVTDNATYIFDQWALILKEGNGEGYMMGPDAIDERCEIGAQVRILVVGWRIFICS